MSLKLAWRVRKEDALETVPQDAICWLDKDIERSPIQLTVRPSLIEAASARMLLSSHTLLAGETIDAVFFFQVWIPNKDCSLHIRVHVSVVTVCM